MEGPETPRPGPTILRAASKNDHRYIARAELGFYRGLILAAEYSIDASTLAFSASSDAQAFFYPALARCIADHPALSTVVHDAGGGAPQIVRLDEVDLRKHLRLLDPATTTTDPVDETATIRRSLVYVHDLPWTETDRVPAWRLYVLPLPARSDEAEAEPGPGRSQRSRTRFLAIFDYSHALGDGTTGLAFHRSFLAGLRQQQHRPAPSGSASANPGVIVPSATTPLAPPLEAAGVFPISWSYLLGPLVRLWLPRVLHPWLIPRNAHISPDAPGAWRGQPLRYDPDAFRTGLECVRVDGPTVAAVLAQCRARGAKLTGLLAHLVARALSQALLLAEQEDGSRPNCTCFLGQIVVNLRPLLTRPDDDGGVPLTNDDMGNYASALFETFPFSSSTSSRSLPANRYDEPFWHAVRHTTAALADRTRSLADQPVGLLRYLSDVPAWLRGQLGQPREATFEISNVMAFDPDAGVGAGTGAGSDVGLEGDDGAPRLHVAYFSQPANALGALLNVNVVSVKGADGARGGGGPLVLTLTWQRGVLGLSDEDRFVGRVGEALGRGLREVAEL